MKFLPLAQQLKDAMTELVKICAPDVSARRRTHLQILRSLDVSSQTTEVTELKERNLKEETFTLEAAVEFLRSVGLSYEDVKAMYIPPWLGRKLFYTSFFLAVPFICACALRLWDCAATVGVIFLTSLNHWRWPRMGARRRMDLTAVAVGACHHVCVAAQVRSFGFFSLLVCVLFLYGYGRTQGNKGDHASGVKCHMLVHTCTLFNVRLYPQVALHRSAQVIPDMRAMGIVAVLTFFTIAAAVKNCETVPKHNLCHVATDAAYVDASPSSWSNASTSAASECSVE